eukprot:scaffold498135_cov34-Prasinocladus_malaysianus.AAC.1
MATHKVSVQKLRSFYIKIVTPLPSKVIWPMSKKKAQILQAACVLCALRPYYAQIRAYIFKARVVSVNSFVNLLLTSDNYEHRPRCRGGIDEPFTCLAAKVTRNTHHDTSSVGREAANAH